MNDLSLFSFEKTPLCVSTRFMEYGQSLKRGEDIGAETRNCVRNFGSVRLASTLLLPRPRSLTRTRSWRPRPSSAGQRSATPFQRPAPPAFHSPEDALGVQSSRIFDSQNLESTKSEASSCR